METASPGPIAPESGAAAQRGDRTLPIVLVAALAVVGAVLVANRPDETPTGPHATSSAEAGQSWTPTPRPAGETVSLTVDFGNGARREFTLPWVKDMTIGDLMQAARDIRPGIAYNHKGAGKMAYLTSLEGVANEGQGGRYWLYGVDDRPGDVSFAVQPLAAGAAVLWEFRRGE